MSTIILFQLLTLLAFYLAVQRISNENFSVLSVYIERLIIVAVLTAELIFYCIYRKKIKARNIAWRHLTCLIAAFIVLPLIQAIIPFWMVANGGLREPGSFYRLWGKIELVLYWTLVVAGHLFFIQLILKGLYRGEEEPSMEEGDLLNDYA